MGHQLKKKVAGREAKGTSLMHRRLKLLWGRNVRGLLLTKTVKGRRLIIIPAYPHEYP
jgi:hypothetical protein